MADAKYRTREYRDAAALAKKAQRRGEWLVCQQPECLEETRDIAPTDLIDIAHDDSGTVVLGPAHRRCNRSDGGKRRGSLTAAPRWVL